MVRVTEEEEIGTGALEGQGFLYILMQRLARVEPTISRWIF
jgi:hypothetical protein